MKRNIEQIVMLGLFILAAVYQSTILSVMTGVYVWVSTFVLISGGFYFRHLISKIRNVTEGESLGTTWNTQRYNSFEQAVYLSCLGISAYISVSYLTSVIGGMAEVNAWVLVVAMMFQMYIRATNNRLIKQRVNALTQP